MPKKPSIVNSGLHPLAIAQARSHAEIARLQYSGLSTNEDVAACLAFLVNASFAIELYLKSLMIAGRNGQVTREHHLQLLYDDFPAFLKDNLEYEYQKSEPHSFGPIRVVGIIQSAVVPDTPNRSGLETDYMTFEGTIRSLGNSFVRARYFFDEINSDDYSYFELPFEAIAAVFSAVDVTYRKFVSGGFKGAIDAAR